MCLPLLCLFSAGPASAAELCNGVDDDDDGLVDEGPVVYSVTDADADGSGDPLAAALAADCAELPPAALVPDDCDDADPATAPSAAEACNGQDDDCDGSVDEEACHCPQVTRSEASAWMTCLEEIDAKEAATACVSDGWHLASIDSVETQEAVQRVVTAIDADAFIGLNDVVEEGVFVWEDGTPLTYTNWGPGQPNDLFGQDCVDLDASGAWSDASCTGQQAYICELEGACEPRLWFDDADADGLGDPDRPTWACVPEDGRVGNALDCDDADADRPHVVGGVVTCEDVAPDPGPVDTALPPTLEVDMGDGVGTPPTPDYGFGLGCATGPEIRSGWLALFVRR